MDTGTIAGILFGVICIVISILLNGSLLTFWDLPSVFITIGGGIASTLIGYRINEVALTMKVVAKAFRGKPVSYIDTIKLMVSLSHKARREGLLALESDLENIDDEFTKECLQLVIDGIEPEVIRQSIDLEIENLRMRHEKGQGLFKTMGALFPAWGMIGTLIGLVNLLRSLDDPSQIGPSMAVALITTFYGSVLANFVCNPIANKLGIKSKEEINNKEMITMGVLFIQAGENPRIVEHKLKTFLSPEQKQQYYRETQQKEQEKSAENASDAVVG